jgi:hypothetical protein
MRLRLVAAAIVAALVCLAVQHKFALPPAPDSGALITGIRDQVSPFRFALTTDPEPPGYGSPVALRVKISDAAGQPLDGVSAEANFSVIGADHGAQHVILHRKGRGVYEGTANLEMAGSWTVDLMAEKDGKRGRERLTLEVSVPQQRSPEPRNPNEDPPES